MLGSMRSLARRQRTVRIIVSVVLALVASLRSGGIALACELGTTPSHETMQMDDASMPSHGDASSEGCDEPERARECALMAACAPAVSSSGDVDTTIAQHTASAIASPSRAPAPVDRSPETPPPRA
jgi:hypothetical protein